MGGKRILKSENISFRNSIVGPVIPQAFHKQTEHKIGIYSHSLCKHTSRKAHVSKYCECIVYILHVITWLSESGGKKNLCFFHILVFSPFVCKLLSLVLPFLDVILFETKFLNFI